MRGNPSIYRKQRVVRKGSYCALPQRSQTFGKVTIFQKGQHLSEYIILAYKYHSVFRIFTNEIFWSSCFLKNKYFFVYFLAVDWFADSRVFGIYTLLIKIILPWEVIFQIKPRILEGNNFLKGTMWVQWTWFFS